MRVEKAPLTPRPRDLLQQPLLRALHLWSFLPDFRGKYRVRCLLLNAATALQRRLGSTPVRLRSGVWIEVDLSIGMCRWILTNDVGEPQTRRVLAEILRPGDTVVDVGGNLGYFSLCCAQLVGPKGHVIAFEPGDRMHGLFRRNLALNGDLADTIGLHKAAAAHVDSVGVLNILARGAEDTAFVTLESPGARDGVSGSVRVVRLDTALAGVNRGIRLLKIDVEGAELEVLRGAARIIQRHRPHLIVELSVEQQARYRHHPKEIVAWLRDHGYRLCWTGALSRPYEEADLARGRYIDVVASPDGAGLRATGR